MNVIPDLTLVADSLGWAVLHSLWQGALAACIIYGVRSLTRERASEARYFAGIVTLCALLCAFIGTFIYYYMTGAEAVSFGIGREATINLALPSTLNTVTNPLLRITDYTHLIGMFWTVCFAVLGVRYLSAFRITHKLRTHGISDLTEECQSRFRALVEASGVTPKVRACFSEYVSSPITFGFLKPIVLVPTWFFTGMTPEQCEAVLLHELAHIRRHDYLTNILQIAIKTVFFYHPAVGFICKGLDTDREHACDDFAVMLTKNPEGLATALGTIRLKAARDGGVFALSASGEAGGRDAPLMHRLKRLMGTQSKGMQSSTSRGLAATVMIVSALALVMTLGATASQAHPHKPDTVTAPNFEAAELEAPNAETPVIDKLAGAPKPDFDDWDGSTQNKNKKKIKKKISVNGKTYKSTAFDFSTDGKGTDTINGKTYPSKYAYSVYTRDGAKDGKSYVVKFKNGKRYMEIGDNWFRVDSNYNKISFSVPTPPTPPTPLTPSVPPIVSENNYWVSDKVFAATEARLQRAAERREAALERTDVARNRAMERAEKSRENALRKSGKQREKELERAGEQREAAIERAEGLREDALEREITRMERKIVRKQRDLARDKASRERDIGRLERDAAKKQADYERKLRNNPNMSQDELGRMQGEIGLLQGKIGRIQGHSGQEQGGISRLQAELGSLQAKIGRIQGTLGQTKTAQYYEMRDKLIPQLKSDGYMKSDRSKVTIKMTPTDIFINSKQLSDAQEGKYCDIISDYISREGDVKKIVIKPGYLHVSQKGDGHNTSFMLNEN